MEHNKYKFRKHNPWRRRQAASSSAAEDSPPNLTLKTRRIELNDSNSTDESTNSVYNPHFNSNRGRGRQTYQNKRPYTEEKRNMQTNRFKKHRTYDKFKMGFKKLEELSLKNEYEVIMDLINKRTGFEELLESKMTDDTIILVLRILAKSSTTPFHANRTDIMNLASNETFIESLCTFILHLQLQGKNDRGRCSYFWNDVKGFFENLIIICTAMLESVPTRACEILPKMIKAVILTLPHFESDQQLKISESIHIELSKLEEKINLTILEIQKKKTKAVAVDQHELPPNDFRDLSVYPTHEELVTSKTFLRTNIVEGAYENVDEYLDIQFRLLKEDFVAPLRESISSYLDQRLNKHHSKISNIRIYPNSFFIQPYLLKSNMGVLVEFCNTRKKRTMINYNYSKRFMYGSLACFTNDNFQSLLFGRVLERNPDLLQKGQVVVGFEEEYNNYQLNVPYIMIECSVYFEPYYHVLNALQTMHEFDFPMKKYIVDVSVSVETPDYVSESSIFEIGDYKVPLLHHGAWPTAKQLHLDETQYSAFQAGLTRKFAIIQGPPGTGKTYLGLKIAKALIKNRSFWYQKNKTPLLVVCFTNHALDQFLEGLIYITDKVIRVGGQSKNEKLEKFNLLNKARTSSTQFHPTLHNLRLAIKNILRDIATIHDNLTIINAHDKIVDFKYFLQVDDELKDSLFMSAINNDILAWLFGGRSRKHERQIQQAKQQKHVFGSQQGSDISEEQLQAEFNDLQNADQINETEMKDEFDYSHMTVSNRINYITGIQTLQQLILNTENTLLLLNNKMDENMFYNYRWKLERKLLTTYDELEYLKGRFEERKSVYYTIKKPIDINLETPHYIEANQRWKLYFYWLERLRQLLLNKLHNLQTRYQLMYKQFNELKNMNDIQVMKQMLVIGMTTTCAARLQSTLQVLRSPIVIVEEAAEVLESHIVVSLTSHCQHLIVIGDHQQLRPSTANYKIEKDYKLGISLFERMVMNNVPCSILGVQHRMRPQIAKLIVPTIYPRLRNHSSVLLYPSVRGIIKSLFFISHTEPEQSTGDFSKVNTHEAQFMILLCRYLILNGYQPKHITILAAYSGQMFELWKLRKKHHELLRDVRIAVLDNYQGEESKIILLSLVRSNNEKSVGFLKIENRVCVALSRAKEGFYMMGNMNLLSQNSQIWPKIKTTLEDQGAIGDSISLRCQIHFEMITQIKDIGDFKSVQEGGCNKVCEKYLTCGHICKRLCHVTDREHKTTKCKDKCLKILCSENHGCPNMCYEECSPCKTLVKRLLECNHEHAIECSTDITKYKCKTPVAATLPCGHAVEDKPCFISSETFRCPFPCETRVEPCGHACLRSCHSRSDPDHLEYNCNKACARTKKNCSTGTHLCEKVCYEECEKVCYEECEKCDVFVLKQRTICSHAFRVPCHSNVDDLECHKPCEKLLPCGHKCFRKCFEQCGNCQVKVSKVVDECGHTIKVACSETAKRGQCTGKCPRLLSCGHACLQRCKDDCTKFCKELVSHNKAVSCGHNFKIECYLLTQELPSYSYELLKFCQEPCNTLLKCKHNCKGTCGSCAQGRIHESCQEKCGRILICGHECEIPCREICQPCARMCSYNCKHSKCKKRCGEPCTNCKERCPRACRHVKCKNPCGEICSVGPCVEPCPKLLHCRHLCVGFCGDPCPPLCRICDNEELTTVFFGTEDEPHARFILLEECKHVIESEAMQSWLETNHKQSNEEITYKCCPKCKTALTSTVRFADYVKQTNKDISEIKNKLIGNRKALNQNQSNLLMDIKVIKQNFVDKGVFELNDFLKVLQNNLKPTYKNRRQHLNQMNVASYTAKIGIVKNIVNETKKWNPTNLHNSKVVGHVRFLLLFINRNNDRITNQEINDIQRELPRLNRIVQLEKFDSLKNSIESRPQAVTLYTELCKSIFSATPYSDILDADIKNKLNELNKIVSGGLAITETERIEIVRAMGMAPGHWFKCPNNHYYAIGDCGGAMQTSKCIECGAQVGGTSHTLLSTNAHTNVMDGSTHAAWSETANNLGNYANLV